MFKPSKLRNRLESTGPNKYIAEAQMFLSFTSRPISFVQFQKTIPQQREGIEKTSKPQASLSHFVSSLSSPWEKLKLLRKTLDQSAISFRIRIE
jgi:hypothetical protein